MAEYDLQALIDRLTDVRDTAYAQFTQGLIPGIQSNFLGVRLPVLRSIARELARRDDWRDFLEASRCHEVFELRMLHGMVIGSAKCAVDERISLLDAFIPHISDWSLCDSTCTSLKPGAKDREALFEFAATCADSDEEFRKRFGLVLLMNRYRDAAHMDRVMSLYRRFSHEGYYARMAAAWGLATLWLSDREGCIAILREQLWDEFTHNKAIQKLCESRRVSEADKALARSLRRERSALP